MEYWWNIYSRGRWQDEFELIKSVEAFAERARLYAQNMPMIIRPSKFRGIRFADNICLITIMLSAREHQITCRDYAAFYENSGGLLLILKSVKWIGQSASDADFIHRVDNDRVPDYRVHRRVRAGDIQDPRESAQHLYNLGGGGGGNTPEVDSQSGIVARPGNQARILTAQSPTP